MGKERLTFGHIETKKLNFNAIRLLKDLLKFFRKFFL